VSGAVSPSTSGGNVAGTSGNASSFGAYLTANGGVIDNVASGANGGSGGGGSGYTSTTGGAGGSNGASGSGGYGSWTGGTGQGSPIVSSSTTVMGLVFQAATFSAGAGGTDSGALCGNYRQGGPGGGILINGSGQNAGSGTSGATGGVGYGASGGNGCSATGGIQVGGNSASGVVYVEW
jgi:hypothetical protein